MTFPAKTDIFSFRQKKLVERSEEFAAERFFQGVSMADHPFHNTVVPSLQDVNEEIGLLTLGKLIENTDLPGNHDAITKAWTAAWTRVYGPIYIQNHVFGNVISHIKAEKDEAAKKAAEKAAAIQAKKAAKKPAVDPSICKTCGRKMTPDGNGCYRCQYND